MKGVDKMSEILSRPLDIRQDSLGGQQGDKERRLFSHCVVSAIGVNGKSRRTQRAFDTKVTEL